MNATPLARRCDGVTRRDFVRIGSLAALGVGLADLFRVRASAADSASAQNGLKSRNCILIWLDGGPSHLETFDLKPDAPLEVRGPFSPIQTSVTGIQICELMPETARRMDRLAVIRSVTSPLGEHNFGAHYLLTGYKPSPALEYPSYGSVVASLRGGDAVGADPADDNAVVLPRHVAVPDFRVGGGKMTGEGFLPARVRPFSVEGDPAKPDFRVRHLDLYPSVTPERLARRRAFQSELDGFARRLDQADADSREPHFDQAYRLIASSEARQAFDLAREPDDVRQRYGGRTIGQSCLLARRLIERGVPFVTVNNTGWDTHQDQYTRLKEGYTGAKVPVGLIPSLDRALGALLDDLIERGLWDDTLVVVMGEFGRTPKLNTSGGRDHWPRVFSVALAGGGVAGGQAIGTSDAHGESPKDRPITPSDLACTLYTLLGVDPDHLLQTTDGRPVHVSQGGTLIRELVT